MVGCAPLFFLIEWNVMYKISKAVVMSTEEKVAKKLGLLVMDLTLDLEKVGYHLAHSNPFLYYSRALEVLESARYNRNEKKLDKWGEYQ